MFTAPSILRKTGPRVWLNRCWADLSLNAKGLIVVMIPLLALVLNFTLSRLAARELITAAARLEKTRQAQSSVDQLRASVGRADSAFHTYRLAGREEVLETYRAADKVLPGLMAGLFSMLGDDPAQTERLWHIQALADDARGAVGTLTRELPQPGEPPPTGDGETRAAWNADTLSALRGEVDALGRGVEALIAKQRAKVERILNWDLIGDWSELGGGLLGAFLAVRLFSAGVVRRAQRLEENTTRLLEELPMLDVGAGADELGRLGRGLEQASAVLSQRRREANEHAERLRQNEDTLRESQRRLRLALRGGAMGLWRSDLKTGVEEWDEQVQRFNGWEPGTFPGTPAAFLSRIHPDDRAGVLEALRHTLEQRCENTLCYRVIWPDQSVHWLEDRGAPDLDAAGNIIALTGISMDITDRREAEDALRAAKAEAERANAAKSEFLSRMSHELRTPLNAILGFGQLLELSQLPECDAQGVEHILKGGRHLLELINEVLDLSRVEAGHLNLSPEPVGIGAMLNEVLALIRPLATPRDIELISRDAPASLGSYVYADRQRLRQVLLNLLSNAVKYNRDHGQVTLSCARNAEGTRLRVTVADTGGGISAQNLPRLFAPFERLDAENGAVEGSGLGLALSKRLIESMGGTIGVESQPGLGSTFWVELALTDSPTAPLVEAPLPDDSATAAEAVHVSTDTKTVLSIEDNPSNLQLLEQIFQRRPWLRLRSAMQGNLGLEFARKHRPDLILLDLHLPDLRGDTVLARLRAQPETAAIPVVMISADATPGQIERLLAAGAYAYLTKPFDVAELLRVVDEVTTGSRQIAPSLESPPSEVGPVKLKKPAGGHAKAADPLTPRASRRRAP